MSTDETRAARKMALAVVDLAGWYRTARKRDALELAAFLDDYYQTVEDHLAPTGVRVAKLLGDGVLVAGPAESVVPLVEALPALHGAVLEVARQHRLETDVGTNVHLAVVAAGALGPRTARGFDVIGEGVNHVFVMGNGPGVRISEPVYRQLPNERRGPWRKHRPPATYTRSS